MIVIFVCMLQVVRLLAYKSVIVVSLLVIRVM